MSGWWQLIGLVPFLGLIILIVLMAREGVVGANEYGANLSGAMASASASPVPAQQDAPASSDAVPTASDLNQNT